MTIRASDRAASRALLHHRAGGARDRRRPTRASQFTEWDDFSLARGRRRRARSTAASTSGSARPRASASTRSGRPASTPGYRDDGAPGPRPEYRDDYYGGFLLDPDGNSAEAVHHGGRAPTGASTTSGSASPTSRRRALLRDDRAATPGSARSSDERRARAVRGRAAARSRSSPATPTRARPHGLRRRPTTRPSTRSTARRSAAGYRDNGAPGERAELPPRLLRRLRARPRRQQRRARQPQPLGSRRLRRAVAGAAGLVAGLARIGHEAGAPAVRRSSVSSSTPKASV